MYQPWIFGAALATGTGLVALTVKLQQPPTPVALPEPTAIDAVRVLPPTPTQVAEPAPVPELELELEPIVIEGRRQPLIPRAATQPASEAQPVMVPTEQHPCSAWRDLGPANVISAKTDSEARVRTLCY